MNEKSKNNSSKTKKVIAIVAITIIAVTAFATLYVLNAPDGNGPTPTQPTPPTPPIGYAVYSGWGFSIEYPDNMTLTEEGLITEDGQPAEFATTYSGQICGIITPTPGPFEYVEEKKFTVMWLQTGGVTVSRDMLENSLDDFVHSKGMTRKGTIRTLAKSGHEVVYQEYLCRTVDEPTSRLPPLELHGFFALWYCNVDEVMYFLDTCQYITDQGLSQVFHRYFESFICH